MAIGAPNIDSDITQLAVKGMGEDIKEAIIEQIKAEAMENLESTLRERLKSLTIENVQGMRNMMQMRDELYVKIKLDGEIIE